MKVFVTGGAGYIGSHTLVQLLSAGHEVCVFDNYCNSSPIALARVRQLTNRDVSVVEADICDTDALTRAVTEFAPDAVIHFAGLKAVGESNDVPLRYYQTNVSGTMNLLSAMDAAKCRRIVFSSSATVYGEAHYLPFDENHPIAPTNPYGRTKAMAEGVIADWARATPDASAVLLRYFNPVGAHESGRIGEDPQGIPNNLMPFIAQVAIGRREKLAIFGDDYETRDGTGERDYIHVVDLADAHLAALDYTARARGCETINVGTGRGVTVKELIAAYEHASGQRIPCEIVPRRPGDIASSYAGTDKARRLLHWRAALGLHAICASSWRWQSENPSGFVPVPKDRSALEAPIEQECDTAR
jgi:UDP-glucose 4-epimerase